MNIVKIFIFIIIIFSNLSEAAVWQNYFSLDENKKYEEDLTYFSYVNPNAPKGGEIKYAIVDTFSQFNLFKSFLINSVIIFDTLMRPAGDDIYNYYPLIADQIMIADDHLSIKMHIDDRAKWSNDTKITVDDILFSYEFCIENQNNIENIRDVQIINNNEITFSFSSSKLYKQTISNIMKIPIISKDFYKNTNNCEFDMKKLPPFSGPYMIDNFSLGNFVQYKRNLNYWAKNLPVNRGRFNFDIVIINCFADSKVAAFSILNQQSHAIVELNSNNWHFAYNQANKLLQKEKINQQNVKKASYFYIYNNSKPFFNNINFRRAINELFDFQYTNAKFFNNDYVRLNTFFPGYYENESNKKIEKNKNKLSNNDILNLFHNAGLKLKNNKLVDCNDKQVEISILLFHISHKRFTEPWINNIENMGIKVNLEIIDRTQHYIRIKNGNYDIAHYEFIFNDIYDLNIIESFHSKGLKNFNKINSPILDQMLDDFYHENNFNIKTDKLKKIDSFLLENHYMMPKWTDNKLRIVFWDRFDKPKLTDNEVKNIDYLKYGFDTWWDKSAELNKNDY